MPTSRFDKFLAIAGILAGIAFVIAGFHSDPPGVGASAQARTQWWNDHSTLMTIAGVSSAYLAVLMTFFATGVRRVLRSGEPGESTYSSAALAGGVLVASGAILQSLLALATVEAADKGQAASVTTLAFLGDFAWMPLIAGLAVFYLATGLGGLRTATLPKWLSIVTIALGAACLLGPTGIAAWFVTPVWLIVAGVLMLRGTGSQTVATATTQQSAVYAG
jgi:hypothetical protein